MEEPMEVESSEGDRAYAVLMATLPENFKEDILVDVKRIPEKTEVQVDLALEVARSRQFKYRGRAAQKFRPRDGAHPAVGLLKMLNRSLARPPGVNEIVRINPKYNIVLEKDPERLSQGDCKDGNGSQPATQGDPDSRYVLRAAANTESDSRIFANRWKDPCNINIYLNRFDALKESLVHNVEATWPNDIAMPIKEARNHAVSFFDFQSWIIGEVKTEHYMLDQDCHVVVLVGVILSFKPLREKTIEESCKNHRILYLPRRSPCSDLYKTLYLLDCDGKEGIQLFSESYSGLNPDEIISGIPCAVKGFAIPGNGFIVAEVVWSTPSPSTLPTLETSLRLDMIFVSGIKFSLKKPHSVELDLLLDYLLGLAGSPNEQICEILPKSKIFFLGNCFDISANIKSDVDYAKEVSSISAMLDSFFCKLAETMEIFLIPGESDPTEKLLPQKPFQPIMFPKLSQRPCSHCYHNPCRLKLKLFGESSSQPLDIILSSGSNVEEIRKYLPNESALTIGESMLKWGHLNPALPGFFHGEQDLECADMMAVQESLPNFYIIGNQDEFGMRDFNGTSIISVPLFKVRNQIVSIQASNGFFKVLPINFNVCL